MRRLYKQVYLTIIASLVLVVLFGGMLWRFAPHPSPDREGFELVGEMVATVLPPADQGAAAQQQFLDRVHDRLKIDLALFDKDRRPRRRRRSPAAGARAARPRGWIVGPRRPGLGDPPARRALAGGADAGAALASDVLGIIGFLGAIALGGGDLRLSAGAAASRAGWSGCRPASSSSAPAISPRA